MTRRPGRGWWRYREEYAVAGVPLYTASAGYNHYCLECASEELLGPDEHERTDRPEPAVEREPDPLSD